MGIVIQLQKDKIMTNKQFKEELGIEVDLAFMKLDADEMRTGIPDWDSKRNGGLTKNNYANLMGLLNFARNHPELSSKQIEDFIKGKEYFKFLNKFVTILPNAVDELRFNGVMYCVMNYTTELEYRKRCKEEKARINSSNEICGLK